MSKVFVLKTNPSCVINDYFRLLELSGFEKVVDKTNETLIKLNLSWTKYFPACSSEPWQLDGLLNFLKKKGYSKLTAIENKTVVTNPRVGAKNNLWQYVLEKHGVSFQPLTEVKWINYKFKSKLLKIHEIFPEGIIIPEILVGKNIIHLPTVKTHGHATTTGAIKNSFGGLLREVRHFCHKYMHEVLVDLLLMQRELHPSIFAVVDGTVCGNGAGPRTMVPVTGNLILASSDSVAIDAVAAKIMGFNPMDIPYIKMCHELNLGVGDPAKIEIIGDDVSGINLGFKTKRSLVIWGDQAIRKGFLSAFEKIILHPKLIFWAPLASNIYHDYIWYPTIGMARIRKFMQTEWGALWQKYSKNISN